MPTSSPPQPSSSGNLKYVVLGLAALLGAAGLWIVASRQKPPPPPAPPAPPPEVQRVNPMAQPDLDLAEPKPDAGQAQPEQAVKHHSFGPKMGEWDCSGDLPTAAKVINDNRAQIRSCYERKLKVNNVLQGDLKLRIKIGSNGRVVASQVTGSIHDQEVFACVRNLASTWAFPVPTGGSCAVVQVPFQFSPKSE